MWLTLLFFAAACGATIYTLYRMLTPPPQETELLKIIGVFTIGILIVATLKLIIG